MATKGLDRLDIVVDGRPRQSLDLHDRTKTTDAPMNHWELLELSGDTDNELKQRRKILA